MNVDLMSRSPDDPGRSRRPQTEAADDKGGAPSRAGASGRAFDLWLNRGLHSLFDGIASEPVPDELLRLIEEDRGASGERSGLHRGDPGAADKP